MINVYYGDSISDDEVSRGPFTFLFYPRLFALVRAEPSVVNHAVGGQGVAEQADKIFGHPLAAGERQFSLLGTVDYHIRGGSSGALDLYEKVLAALVAWRTTNKTLVTDPAFTKTGNWQPQFQSPWPFTWLGTWNDGDSASVDFTDDVFELAHLLVDSHVGAFTIHVDGVLKGTFSLAPPAWIGAVSGRYFAPALARVFGCGAGPHTAVITKQSGTGLFLLWAGQGSNGYPMYLITLPNHGIPTTQIIVDAYNARIASVVSAAQAAGANVNLIEAGQYIVPSHNMVPGDHHPVASGHPVIAATMHRDVP